MKKRLFAALLAIALLVSLFPTAAMAVDPGTPPGVSTQNDGTHTATLIMHNCTAIYTIDGGEEQRIRTESGILETEVVIPNGAEFDITFYGNFSATIQSFKYNGTVLSGSSSSTQKTFGDTDLTADYTLEAIFAPKNAPEPPENVSVFIACSNDGAAHDPNPYELALNDGGFEIGPTIGYDDGSYTCEVTLTDLEGCLAAYNEKFPGHILVDSDAEPTVTYKWVDAQTGWVANGDGLALEVKCEGSKTYTVHYKWGTFYPYEYLNDLPEDAEYAPGEEVTLCTDYYVGQTYLPTPGQKYYFQGWEFEPEVDLDRGTFEMPEGDVTITGKWMNASNNPPEYHTLTVEAVNCTVFCGGQKITNGSAALTVADGYMPVVVFEGMEGYELESVKLNGARQNSTTLPDGRTAYIYRKDPLTGDRRLTVTFEDPDKPEIPDDDFENVDGGLYLVIECVNTAFDHKLSNPVRMKLYKYNYEVGEITGNPAKGYTCTLTVDAETCVKAFDNTRGGTHRPADGGELTDPVIVMRWTGEEWVQEGDDPKLTLTCGDGSHTVTYQWEGSQTPYYFQSKVPDGGEYAPGDTVTLNTDFFPGQHYATNSGQTYQFKGWTVEPAVELEDGTFIMPDEDVVISGQWVMMNKNAPYHTLSIDIENGTASCGAGTIIDTGEIGVYEDGTPVVILRGNTGCTLASVTLDGQAVETVTLPDGRTACFLDAMTGDQTLQVVYSDPNWKPEAPSLNLVKLHIECRNENAAHSQKDYRITLSSAYCSVGEVTGDLEAGFACTVTVENTARYLKYYNDNRAGGHVLVDENAHPTATLEWKNAETGWQLAGEDPVLEVVCEDAVPETVTIRVNMTNCTGAYTLDSQTKDIPANGLITVPYNTDHVNLLFHTTARTTIEQAQVNDREFSPAPNALWAYRLDDITEDQTVTIAFADVEAPSGDELSALGLKAVVDCVNAEEAHESAETALTAENCAIGDPVQGEDGVYTSTITVAAEEFVAAYSEAYGSHTLAENEDDEKTLTLTWDVKEQAWTAEKTSVTFNVECESAPELPAPPTSTQLQSMVTLQFQCEDQPEEHARNIVFNGRDNFTPGEVTGNDAQGYRYSITIDLQKWLARYNLLEKVEHTLADGQASTATVYFTWNDAQETWERDGDNPVIKVACAEETPETVTVSVTFENCTAKYRFSVKEEYQTLASGDEITVPYDGKVTLRFDSTAGTRTHAIVNGRDDGASEHTGYTLGLNTLTRDTTVHVAFADVEAPGGDELSALGLKAIVDCVNTEEAHESAETALTAENCAIGDPVQGEDGVYTSTITVAAEEFVAAYSEAYGSHTLAENEDDEKTLTLTWDVKEQAWTAEKTSVTFNVECESAPELPAPPTSTQLQSMVTLQFQCEDQPEEHARNIVFNGRDNFTPGEVTGNDAQGYRYSITIDLQKWLARYNLLEKVEHTLADGQASTATVYFTWNDAQETWERDGDNPVIKVACAEETPETVTVSVTFENCTAKYRFSVKEEYQTLASGDEITVPYDGKVTLRFDSTAGTRTHAIVNGRDDGASEHTGYTLGLNTLTRDTTVHVAFADVEAPGGDELSALGLKAVVDCVNTEEAHESAETALTTENCAIGDPVRGEDGVYTSTITVEAEAFVAAYAGHALADGEDDVKSLTLTWSVADQAWTAEETSVTFDAICESEIEPDVPGAPSFEDLEALFDGQIQVRCVNPDAGHASETGTFGLYENTAEMTYYELEEDAAHEGVYWVQVYCAPYLKLYEEVTLAGSEFAQHGFYEGVQAIRVVVEYDEEADAWTSDALPISFEIVCKTETPAPDLEITRFTKSLVTSARTYRAYGLAVPEFDRQRDVHVDPYESLTLLYAISVHGDPGAQYVITDSDAVRVGGAPLRGTIDADGRVVAYVAKTFTWREIRSADELVNVAYVGLQGESGYQFRDAASVDVEIDWKLWFPPVVDVKPDGNDLPNWLNTTDHDAYLFGYDDGTIRPNHNITRAEVATIFYRLLTDRARAVYGTDVNSFRDVSAGSWYNEAVSTLSSMGILNGYGDGTFKPNEPITRAELTSIAVRFFDYAAAYRGAFSDVTAGDWFAGSVQAASDLGLVGGYPDGTFRPDAYITRAETVAIVNRMLGRAPHKDYFYASGDMATWPDNSYGAWYYADVQEATNSHRYVWIRVDGEVVEDWTI